MRIGIDARELCGRATGVGRYLHALLSTWAADPSAQRHDFVLYAPEALTIELDARRFATRTIAGRAGTWWEQVRLPRAIAQDRLDVFFAPGYTAPALCIPVVVTIHDLSFMAHPEWFSMREGMRRRWLTRRSAQQACAVITVSQFSRGEIAERCVVPAERLHVVPHGLTGPSGAVRAVPAGSHGETSGAPRSDTVLYVGSIFNRRRVPDLIQAFGLAAQTYPEASLEIVGDDRSHPHQDLPRAIERAGVTGRARWRSFVSDTELAALYASARAFAFLSEYEGFGLTPLEALAAGVPSVLLDTPVARECFGDAALFVRPGDVPGTARALESLLGDEAMRTRLLAAAPATLARYRWDQAARDTLAILERCAS